MLLDVRALKLGQFTLSSGRQSTYYLDLRVVPSYPKLYRLALDAYLQMAEAVGHERFDAVAGMATSGLLMAAPLALAIGKPMVYVRNEEKAHGRERLVEGDLSKGSRALLVDDLATSGDSLAGATEVLRGQGLVITNAIILVDRLEGAIARLSDLGVELKSFASIDQIAPSVKTRSGTP